MRLLLIFMVLVFGSDVGAQPYPVGPLETLVSHAQLLGRGLTTWPDGSLGMLPNADGTWTFYAPLGSLNPQGTQIVRTVGTLDNPIAYDVQILPVVASGCDYYGGGQVFRDPDSSMLLMFAHCEHWLTPNGRRFVGSVALATSWDDGVTWTDLGEVLTTYAGANAVIMADAARVPHPNNGVGGAVIQQGEWFWLYYTERTTLVPRDAISVARAPIADVFSAARQGYGSPWRKYYQGAWEQPGLGGLADELDHPHLHGIGTFAVAYESSRQRYVLIGSDWGVPTPVYLMESPDGLAWTDTQQVPNEAAYAVYFAFPISHDPPAVYYKSSPYSFWGDHTLVRRR